MASQDPPRHNFRYEITKYIEQMRLLVRIANLTDAHPIAKKIRTLEILLSKSITEDGRLYLPKLATDPRGVHAVLIDILRGISQYGYDRMYWLADGYFDELTTSTATKAFLSDRLPLADQFDATEAELFIWGWLKARNLKPILQQDHGKPDLIFTTGDQILCGDVKALMPGSQPSRVKGMISKANKQIKQQTSDNSGICFIRIVEPQLQALDQDGAANPPPFLSRVFDEVHDLLRKPFNKSVGQCIVVWEEQSLTGDIPGWVTVLGTRSSKIFVHEHARSKILINTDFAPKATIAFNIELKGAGVPGSAWRRRP